MNAEEITYYECPQCGEEYTDEGEARECCFIGERVGWACGHCGEDYGTEKEAEECCKKEEQE